MKTAFNINDALLIEATSAAARERTSITHLIEEEFAVRLRTSPPLRERVAAIEARIADPRGANRVASEPQSTLLLLRWRRSPASATTSNPYTGRVV